MIRLLLCKQSYDFWSLKRLTYSCLNSLKIYNWIINRTMNRHTNCIALKSSIKVMLPDTILDKLWLNSSNWSRVSFLVSSYSSGSRSFLLTKTSNHQINRIIDYLHSSRSASWATSLSSCASKLCFNWFVSDAPLEAIDNVVITDYCIHK